MPIFLAAEYQSMKKKRIIFFFFLGFFAGEIQAQFDAQYSLYMENKEAINPGAMTENGLTNLFGVYRQQWVGYFGFGKSAPFDMFFSANTPVNIAGTKHGIGVSFSRKQVGLFGTNSVLLQYSYKAKLFDGELGLGFNAGGIKQTFDKEGADFTGGKDNNYHNHNFNAGVDGSQQDDPFMNLEDAPPVFDAGVGFYFSNKEMYVGLSALHLPTWFGKEVDYGVEKLYVPSIIYLTGGYNISLSDALYILKPSTLMRTDGSTLQVELTGLLEYDKKIQGGMSYRFGDGLVFIAGMNLLSGVYVNLSYDLPLSRMVSVGSLEVSLRYSLKLEFSRNSKHKLHNIL